MSLPVPDLTAPVQRLNYFNGQRLAAADLRLEQDYHVGVRRWLNRSLFTPGIAAGLEVSELGSAPAHAVSVAPGLALDSLGREMILTTAHDIMVTGVPSRPGLPVTGNYLVIEYGESLVANVVDGCAVQLGTTVNAREDFAWGAPSRILAQPKLSWQSRWPKPEENKIVLAQVELDETCAVRAIRTFVRKYVGAAKEVKARPLAFEGEKDLDRHNPKDLYFHVAGGTPERAALLLRAAAFSSLFYSEIGAHQHDVAFTTSAEGAIPEHTHTLNFDTLTTTEAGGHRHEIHGDLCDPDEGTGIEMDSADDHKVLTGAGGVMGGAAGMEVTEAGKHTHTIQGGAKATSAEPGRAAHTHTVAGKTGSVGQNSAVRSASAAYTFLDGLRISFDGADITADVLAQLQERDEPGVATPLIWKQLGDGSGIHNLVASGTREIDLLRLGLDLSPGEHCLRFHVASGGGKILYNLYIE